MRIPKRAPARQTRVSSVTTDEFSDGRQKFRRLVFVSFRPTPHAISQLAAARAHYTPQPHENFNKRRWQQGPRTRACCGLGAWRRTLEQDGGRRACISARAGAERALRPTSLRRVRPRSPWPRGTARGIRRARPRAHHRTAGLGRGHARTPRILPASAGVDQPRQAPILLSLAAFSSLSLSLPPSSPFGAHQGTRHWARPKTSTR